MSPHTPPKLSPVDEAPVFLIDGTTFLYRCENGHEFTAAEPGWERHYCPGFGNTGDRWQCMKPLVRIAPTDDDLARDLVKLQQELA